MLNGFDVGYVFRHPVFLVTYILVVPAWIIAFAGQCAAEAKYTLDSTNGTPVVKYLWYSIWIQFLALCTDQLAVHRFQLAIVLAIAEVFAVYGTEFIFSPLGALKALVWILYLTSEEDSIFYQILNARGNGGLSSYSRSGARRESTAAFANGEGGQGGGGISGPAFAATPRNNGYSMDGYAPAGTETTPQKLNVARDGYGQHSPAESEEQYKHRARAMFAYAASPEDSNEVSFAKGDLLEVVDNTGKWFQIAPSNYLTML
ncbi:MAG: Transmembrane osmosensor [Tremellales sp. Tagirdzhanova-0007]|nr:MAG: Transmembrane osmosensor [Tremellales sp. Tagirdzhanova-0007]